MLTSTITIEPWMPRLGLRGDALLIYAHIYYQSYEGYTWYELDENELSDVVRGENPSATRIVAQLVNDGLLEYEIAGTLLGKNYYKPNIDAIRDLAGEAYDERKR